MREGRALQYKNTDCFLLCVAVDNRESLQNAQLWKTEIRTACDDAPIILVGTKIDLEENRTVSQQDLKDRVKDLGLTGHCETSALNWQQDYNVDAAFRRALMMAYQKKYEL